MNKFTKLISVLILVFVIGFAIFGIVWNSTRIQPISFAEKSAVIRNLGVSLGHRFAQLGKNDKGYFYKVESKNGNTFTESNFEIFEKVLESFKELKIS